MKRPLLILGVLFIALFLVRGAEYVLEKTLDRQLPALLTEALGLPVRIAPLRADIITLTATTDRFEMGPPDRLSVDVKEVRVSLDWSDLLSGEIRLVTVAGAELMLDVSAWPEGDGSPAEDFADLEQWLPTMLDINLLRYRPADGVETEFHQARWRRSDHEKASLAWQSRFPAGTLDVDIDLASLDDLLWLRSFDASITLATDHEDIPVSELSLKISPASKRAYTVDAKGQLAGMGLTVSASGSESWSLPDRSRTEVETALVKNIQEVVSLIFADGVEDGYQRELAAAVPVLDLPRHDAVMNIGELQFGPAMLHDIGFKLTTSGNFLAATKITASGLYGDLLGSAAIASEGEQWDVALSADLKARQADLGLLSRYVNSEWFAREGRIRLKTRGASWAALLDELTGDLRLNGLYRGSEETPLQFSARLDGSPDRFALEQIELQMGNSKIAGQLDASTRGNRFINLQASADTVDVRFLLAGEDEPTSPGIAIPTFLAWLPDYRLGLDLKADALLLPSFRFEEVSAALDRGAETGELKIAMRDASSGSIQFDLGYEATQRDSVQASLQIGLDKAQLSELFRLGPGALDLRTSGTIELEVEAGTVKEVFTDSSGLAQLDIELREDGDWSRAGRENENIRFNGQTRLAVEGDRIVGIQLEQIDIESLEQDLTGSLSLIATRDPVMVADLTSERLNIDTITDWIPESPAAADEKGVLDFLRDTTAGQVKLHVDRLTWMDRNFDDLVVELDSKPGFFSVENLGFEYRDAAVAGGLTLVWDDERTARLDASASINNLRMLEILDIEEQRIRDNLGAPLAGNLRLKGSGQTLQELLAALDGELLLDSTDDAEQNPERLDITFVRQVDGGQINFRQLKLAGSELQGSLKTTLGSPTHYDLQLAGGTLDLTPWELAQKPTTNNGDQNPNMMEQTAATARGLLGFAAQVLGRKDRPTEAEERIFNSAPLDLNPLRENSLSVRGSLGRLYSGALVAEDLEIDLDLGDGMITLAAKAAQANGGPVVLNAAFDGNATPYALSLDAKGEGFHKSPAQANYPTSLHGILSSNGGSEAELAANLNGQIFIELGRGPVDYGGLNFLTADVATSMIRTLIPGAKDRPPEVRCGVSFMQIQDGVGITPFGYAVQTRSANLLGGVEVNLVEETIRVRFRSRSRQGAGISIGNTFASTVELAGPLGDPRIVPNTPGLLFRGWAAFMTAGLSVLGESVMNRVLASEDPCRPVRQQIQAQVCNTDQVLASSPLACPNTAAATP